MLLVDDNVPVKIRRPRPLLRLIDVAHVHIGVLFTVIDIHHHRPVRFDEWDQIFNCRARSQALGENCQYIRFAQTDLGSDAAAQHVLFQTLWRDDVYGQY